MLRKMILGLSLFQLFGCASVPNIPISDHFNGKKFINPTLEEQISPSFSDVFRMAREGRPKWPKKVDNIGVPRLNKKLGYDELSVTFVNHATFLIQFSDLNIFIDPVRSKRASPFSWLGPKRVREPGVKFEELPHIDVIIISHNHYDHFDKKTLKKLNKQFSPKIIVPIGNKALAESIGFKNVQELDWWESVAFNSNTKIVFTPAQHSAGRGLFDRDRTLWGSYFIQNGNQSVYYGGDSGYATHFSEIKKRLGSPDIALLGIGSYAPQWFMQAIHMNPAEGVTAHKDLEAKVSIAMHTGTFQLASEA